LEEFCEEVKLLWPRIPGLYGYFETKLWSDLWSFLEMKIFLEDLSCYNSIKVWHEMKFVGFSSLRCRKGWEDSQIRLPEAKRRWGEY